METKKAELKKKSINVHQRLGTDQSVTADEMDHERTNTRAYEYLCRLEEAKAWIARYTPLPDKYEDFEEEMRKGVFLAEVARIVAPSCVPSLFIDDELQYRHTDNINYFLSALKFLNLPAHFHFEVIDLYEKKNFPKVVYAIHALAHFLACKGIAGEIMSAKGKKFSDSDINRVNGEIGSMAMPRFESIKQEINIEPVSSNEVETLSEENHQKIQLSLLEEEDKITKAEKVSDFLIHELRRIKIARCHNLIKLKLKAYLYNKAFNDIYYRKQVSIFALRKFLFVFFNQANTLFVDRKIDELHSEISDLHSNTYYKENIISDIEIKLKLLLQNKISISNVIQRPKSYEEPDTRSIERILHHLQYYPKAFAELLQNLENWEDIISSIIIPVFGNVQTKREEYLFMNLVLEIFVMELMVLGLVDDIRDIVEDKGVPGVSALAKLLFNGKGIVNINLLNNVARCKSRNSETEKSSQDKSSHLVSEMDIDKTIGDDYDRVNSLASSYDTLKSKFAKNGSCSNLTRNSSDLPVKNSIAHVDYDDFNGNEYLELDDEITKGEKSVTDTTYFSSGHHGAFNSSIQSDLNKSLHFLQSDPLVITQNILASNAVSFKFMLNYFRVCKESQVFRDGLYAIISTLKEIEIEANPAIIYESLFNKSVSLDDALENSRVRDTVQSRLVSIRTIIKSIFDFIEANIESFPFILRFFFKIFGPQSFFNEFIAPYILAPDAFDSSIEVCRSLRSKCFIITQLLNLIVEGSPIIYEVASCSGENSDLQNAVDTYNMSSEENTNSSCGRSSVVNISDCLYNNLDSSVSHPLVYSYYSPLFSFLRSCVQRYMHILSLFTNVTSLKNYFQLETFNELIRVHKTVVYLPVKTVNMLITILKDNVYLFENELAYHVNTSTLYEGKDRILSFYILGPLWTPNYTNSELALQNYICGAKQKIIFLLKICRGCNLLDICLRESTSEEVELYKQIKESCCGELVENMTHCNAGDSKQRDGNRYNNSIRCGKYIDTPRDRREHSTKIFDNEADKVRGLVNQSSIGLDGPEIVSKDKHAGDNNAGVFNESLRPRVDDVANGANVNSMSFYDNNGLTPDILGDSLEHFKENVLDDMAFLETKGVTYRKNLYSEMLCMLAYDIVLLRFMSEEKSKELRINQTTKSNLQAKEEYLDGKIQEYHEYLSNFISKITLKKKGFTFFKTDKESKYGTYRYTAFQLKERGVLEDVFNVSNLEEMYFLIVSEEALKFKIEIYVQNACLCISREFTFDELLKLKCSQPAVIDIAGICSFNVFGFVELLNRKYISS